MWPTERRGARRSVIRRYGSIGFLLAAMLAFVTHNHISKQGYDQVTNRAKADAGLIVNLTSGFVRTYSAFSAHLTNGEMPNPQFFRSKSLENIKTSTGNAGLVSTDVIGFPGREIGSKAKDSNIRNLLLILEASKSTKVVTTVIEKNNQTIHRSLWAFYATDQACVDCHNRLQNLTGSDRWQVGDLMGAQTVDQNVDQALSIVSRTALVQTALLFIAVVAAWLCCLYLVNHLRLNRELKRLATTEPLTGCINRRELYERVNNMQGPTNGALLLLDLDNFKLINDTFGHKAGDKVIQDFSTILRSAVREEDWVTRFGGEEFVVWLPNVMPIDAIKMAERILSGPKDSQVVVDGKKINYTVSIGLHIVQNALPSLFDTWMNAADKLLYRAKKKGRNQIVCEVSSVT